MLILLHKLKSLNHFPIPFYHFVPHRERTGSKITSFLPTTFIEGFIDHEDFISFRMLCSSDNFIDMIISPSGFVVTVMWSDGYHFVEGKSVRISSNCPHDQGRVCNACKINACVFFGSSEKDILFCLHSFAISTKGPSIWYSIKVCSALSSSDDSLRGRSHPILVQKVLICSKGPDFRVKVWAVFESKRGRIHYFITILRILFGIKISLRMVAPSSHFAISGFDSMVVRTSSTATPRING